MIFFSAVAMRADGSGIVSAMPRIDNYGVDAGELSAGVVRAHHWVE